jgi:hypothetical protein
MSRKWNTHGSLEPLGITHATDIAKKTKAARVYTNMQGISRDAVLSTHGLGDTFGAMLHNMVSTVELGIQTTEAIG